VMCGGSILSCCPRNPNGHERALKEEEANSYYPFVANLNQDMQCNCQSCSSWQFTETMQDFSDNEN